jgi:hypothetical protein
MRILGAGAILALAIAVPGSAQDMGPEVPVHTISPMPDLGPDLDATIRTVGDRVSRDDSAKARRLRRAERKRKKDEERRMREKARGAAFA